MSDKELDELNKFRKNLGNRVRIAYKIMNFFVRIEGAGCFKLKPKEVVDIMVVIAGARSVKKSLREYCEEKGFN